MTISDIMGGSCWGQSKSILYDFHCPPVYFQVLFNELVCSSLVIFCLGCVRDQLTLSVLRSISEVSLAVKYLIKE